MATGAVRAGQEFVRQVQLEVGHRFDEIAAARVERGTNDTSSCTIRRSTVLTPPISAPLTVPTPPTTSRSRKGMPTSIGKSMVPTVPRYIPSRPPASPAIAAASAKTNNLVHTRLTPTVALAAGLSRNATRRRPNAPRRNHPTNRPRSANTTAARTRKLCASSKSMPKKRGVASLRPAAPKISGWDRLDIERPDIFQLGFGHGAHFCLGAHLARVELQVALESLLSRFPDLRLAVPPDQVQWKDGSAVWGLEALPVFF